MAGLIGATGATDAGANADAMSQRCVCGGGGRKGGNTLAAVRLPLCIYLCLLPGLSMSALDGPPWIQYIWEI